MSLDDLIDLSDRAVAVPEAQVFEATIAADADGLAPVRVVIPEFDPDLSFGPAPWMPVARADGIYYPKKGDRAVVLRPDPASVWIAAWTPEAATPDVTYA